MRDSKQIAKIVFLCLLPIWFRATADGQTSTKFVTCVIDTFCVWLKMDKKNGSLLVASNCEKATISFVMSVCLSVCTHGRNFMKLGTWIFFEHLSGKLKFRVNLTRITALWHEDLQIFFINSRSTFLIIKSISEKWCTEMLYRNVVQKCCTEMLYRNVVQKIKTHILLPKKFFFRKSCRLRNKGEKILYPTVRYDLGLKNCWSEIKDYVTVQGDRFEYLNMMAVVRLSVNSHALYQLYRHTCWIAGKHYHSDLLTCVADLRITYLCLTGRLDNIGQGWYGVFTNVHYRITWPTQSVSRIW
jgi:hypothetical protein